MKLPNVEQAVVTRKKVEGYLLSWTHPAGRSKTEFFIRFGFKTEAWKMLANALVDHAASYEVQKTEETEFGMRYIIEGAIETPDKRNPPVRVVWFVRHVEMSPHLVTAYPC